MGLLQSLKTYLTFFRFFFKKNTHFFFFISFTVTQYYETNKTSIPEDVRKED